MNIRKTEQFILLIGNMGNLQLSSDTKLKAEGYETTCIDLFKLMHDTTSLFSLIDIIEQHVIGQDKVLFFMENETYNSIELIWIKHIILTLLKVMKSEHIDAKLILYINDYKVSDEIAQASTTDISTSEVSETEFSATDISATELSANEFSIDNFKRYLEKYIKTQHIEFQILSEKQYELEILSYSKIKNNIK